MTSARIIQFPLQDRPTVQHKPLNMRGVAYLYNRIQSLDDGLSIPPPPSMRFPQPIERLEPLPEYPFWAALLCAVLAGAAVGSVIVAAVLLSPNWGVQ